MKRVLSSYAMLLIISMAATQQQFHLTNGWYPTDKGALEKTLDQCDAKAQELYAASVLPASVRAIITPHAGISYSGALAAAAYRLIGLQTKRLIVLAPDHAGLVRGIALPSWSRYQMPHGTVSIDTKAIKQLAKMPLFAINDTAFTTEHSFEMQLPFIVRYVPKATIIPMIIGSLSCDQADQIAQVIAPYINKQTVVVVTTDFIHYGKRFNYTPFTRNQQREIRHLNSRAVDLIEQAVCRPFEQFINDTQATICGVAPLKLLLAMLQQDVFGDVEPRLLAYGSSSDHDQEDTVSYISMLFTTQKLARQPIATQLTQQEKRGLVMQAQEVLHHLHDTDYNPVHYYPLLSYGIKQPRGAFTTLRTADGQLRGCIGRIVTQEPLYKTIAMITKDTALHDTRFEPVTKNEAPSLGLKLSILSVPKSVAGYRAIKLGKHGIIISKNGASAVFLPEVPAEFGWNLEQTLTQLAQKAGLAGDSWRDKGMQFELFESVEIPEKKDIT